MFLCSCFLNSRSFFANHSGRKTQVVVAISFVVPVVVFGFFVCLFSFYYGLIDKVHEHNANKFETNKDKTL